MKVIYGKEAVSKVGQNPRRGFDIFGLRVETPFRGISTYEESTFETTTKRIDSQFYHAAKFCKTEPALITRPE